MPVFCYSRIIAPTTLIGLPVMLGGVFPKSVVYLGAATGVIALYE
jgi:hypothetical protein